LFQKSILTSPITITHSFFSKPFVNPSSKCPYHDTLLYGGLYIKYDVEENISSHIEGPGWLNELGSNNSYKLITNTTWVHARLCKLQKGCTRLATSSDKVYQLLAHGRWFSPGTPASSTTKTGRHDIAGILLKWYLTPNNQSINQPINHVTFTNTFKTASHM